MYLVKSVISEKVYVSYSDIHGVGMFAKNCIKKEEVVCIKGGYILKKDELAFSGPISSYLPIDDDYFLGAKCIEEEEQIKLNINHSCNPNCGLRGEIVFVAIRDIKIGEELTYDYAFVDNENYEFMCNCGSDNCRKRITGFDWKIQHIQDKYKRYFSPYLQIKMQMP